MRFVTALVLMGLLLGAGGARAGLSGPALAAAESRPAVAESTSVAESTVDGLRSPLALGGSSRTARHEASGVAGDAPVAVAEQPSATLVSAPPSEQEPVAAGSVVSTVQVPAALFGGQPDRPLVGAAVGGWPAGDAYARVAGPRAPPLG
ncbi:hypothetical protein O7626_26610 [Micromonospora sp. WMMD1102]|uniref:hypothetical protein n=1 Tax=Micromonospora sp. WMMD1102 TaxID=3016105 RepID=UPI0024156811|nr:hypothetical protein [Micromonospora sp. WMMD1102]MDG4789453.1 hypothetical protein [Micromonospora sp. WMMD1102]